MDKVSGDELASVVENSLNTYNFTEDIEKFVERMSCSHRTLQQTFTRLCIKWLTHLSEVGNNYDLRNEASVDFTKSIKKELNKAALPFI